MWPSLLLRVRIPLPSILKSGGRNENLDTCYCDVDNHIILRNMLMETKLFLSTIEDMPAYKECDGCGHKFEPKEKFISGIEGCTQCWVCLCKKCVMIAVKMIMG